MASELETLTAIGKDRNPTQEKRYQELSKAGSPGHPGGVESPTGSYLAPGAGAGGGDVIGLARQMYKLGQEFADPAIQKLEARRPLITEQWGQEKERLEAERDPLEKRYERLVKDITKFSTTATSREFGRRGIPLSSGIYESALAEKIEPQVERVGLAKEESLRNLLNLIAGIPLKEQMAQQDVSETIAGIESGYGPQAIQAALAMLAQRAQAKQHAAQLGLQEWIARSGAAAREAELGWEQQKWGEEWPVEKRLAEYQLGKPYYAPSTGGASQWRTAQGLRQQMMGDISAGMTLSDVISRYGHGVDIGDIVQLYSATSRYGPAEEDWAKQYLTDLGI